MEWLTYDNVVLMLFGIGFFGTAALIMWARL